MRLKRACRELRLAVESVAQQLGEVALEALTVVVGEGGRPLCATARAAYLLLLVADDQLHVDGGLLMAGLLTSAGVGYLVLFRTNRHPRENAVIVVGLFLVACVWGLVFAALEM